MPTSAPSSIRFQITADLYNRLAAESKKTGMTLSELIRRTLDAKLPQKAKP